MHSLVLPTVDPVLDAEVEVVRTRNVPTEVSEVQEDRP